MKIKGRYLLILIAMSGLIATSVGLPTNVAGLFFTPVAEEFGILKGSVSMTLTICNIVFALGGLVAPKLLKEDKLKVLLIAGTAVIAGSTALLALSPNIFVMYVLNALRGFACGILGFVMVTMVINNWFIANVGLATSIAMSCSGLAGALFSPVISSVIESMGWRAGYVFVAILMAVLNLPAIFFLPSLDPKTKGMVPLGYEEKAEQKTNTPSETKTGGKEINKLLFAMAIVYSFLAGKIVLGALGDKLGSRTSLLLYCALTIAAAAILLTVHATFAMYVGAALFGLVYSLGTVGVVMITKDTFGLENYSRTYPTISLAGTIANALFSSLIGFMFDASGSYATTLIMMLAILGLNTFIIITAYSRK